MIINHLKQTKQLFFFLLIFFIFYLVILPVTPIYAQEPTPTPLDALISWNPPITLTRELNVNYETFIVNDLLAVNDIIYAATDNGLFVSKNNGKTRSWQGLNNNLLNYDIRSLLELDGRLYAGAVGGMFVSYNQGKTWQPINNGLPDMIKVNSLLTSKGILYAGTNTGVFVSDDNGKIWRSMGQGLPENININGLLEVEGWIYASTLSGVFVSDDGGSSWRAINEGLTASAILSMAASDGRLYAGTFIGVFASDDGGESWQWMNKGMTSSIISSLLAVNGRLYAGTNSGEINISDDRGENWRTVNRQLTSATISSLLELNGRLYAGTLNGIFISDDRAETWHGTADVLSNSTILTALGVDGQLYVSTDGGGMFVSKDNGRSWQELNAGLTDRFSRLLLAVENRLYVGTRATGIYVSKDAGETWQAMNDGLTDISILSLLELDGRLYAGTSNGKVFMLSQSEGGVWQDISEGLPDSAGTLSLLVVDRRLYAGTRGVGIYTLDLDGNGNIWQEANNGLTSMFVNSLLEVKGQLYAATNSGIFISSDNGLNWYEANLNMSDITVLSMLEANGQLYAATNNGLFGSQDAGFNWRKMNEGMSNIFVRTLIKMDGRLYAGTNGGGIFISEDGGTTWNPANGPVPLHQTVRERFPLFIQDLLPSDTQDIAYIATRGGGVWTMTTEGVVNKLPILGGKNAQALAIGGEQIYVATLNGLLFNDQSWKGVSDKNLQGDVIYDVAVVASSSFSLQRIIKILSFRTSTTYVVTSDQTMYKSIDNGMILQAMPAKIPGFKTTSLLITSDETNIYAATVEGLYHSSDKGQSWQPTSVMGDVVYDLATLDGQTFYAATSGGLFKSELQTDGTSNWVRSLTGEFSSVLVHPSNSQIIMAAAGNRLQLSRDAGNAWEELPLPPNMTVDIIAISANFPDILWAADVQTGRVVRGQISSIEIPGQTIWFQVIAVWGGWFLIVGMVGLFGLSRYSGLSFSLLLRQNIMILPVALRYSDYRQQWELGSPLAQLLVLLVPPRKGLSTQEFILALNKLDVPLETDQLETELDSAIRDNLLCQKEGRYHATTPPLAVALQDHEGKTSRFHLAEKIRHDHPLSANASRFFSRAGFNLKPVLGQNQLPSRSKVNSSGFMNWSLRRFFGRAGFNLKPVLKQEQLLYRAEVASTGFMKRNLPAKIYARFLPGEILDDNEVLNIKEQVYQVDRQANVIFVVTNRRPTESGWAQIGTLRLGGLTILPLDNALINEGLSTGRERMLLRNEIEQRLGADYDPYDVRDPVAGAFSFFGREVLVETLFRRLVEGRQLGIFGLRKLGKSSLLHALRSRTSFPVAEINLQTIGRNKNLDDLYHRIFRYWQQEIRLKTNLSWTAPSFQTNQTNFVNITLDLLNWMKKNQVEPRLGLFLDEVELLVPRPDGSGPDLERYLTFMGAVRGLIDEDGRISLVVASLNPSISRINAWNGEQNPTFNLFQEINLPPLSSEDIIKMVRHIGLQIGLVYSEESLTEIANLSGGHPFLARQLCSLLYKERNYRIGQIEVTEIPDGVHQFIYDNATVVHLENGLWKEAGNTSVWGKVGAEANQAILLELARSDRPVMRLKPEMITGLDRNEVQAALINLEKYYFVHQPEIGYYNIQFGLLREWLRRRKLKL